MGRVVYDADGQVEAGTPHRVDPYDVVQAWRLASSRIPARFAVGNAEKETNFTVNERDVGDQSDGTDSIGIFQLSKAEQLRALVLGSLLDLDTSCAVFATIMEHNLDRIIAAAALDEALLPPDVWAYLRMSHNLGLGGTLKSIEQNGLDWAAYKARNPNVSVVANGSGDAAITGGSRWDRSWDALPPAEGSSGYGGRLVVLLVLVGLAAWFLLGRSV